jgi:hypothetical protein
VALASLKQCAFRSFQICQETGAKRESAPFLLFPCQHALSRRHQTMTERSAGSSCWPSAEEMWNQTSRVNGQQVRMWSIDSGT